MALDFAAVVTKFYRRIQMIQPETWIIPPQPVFHLHFGPPDAGVIRQVMTAVGGDTVLLYVYYGDPGREDEFLASVPDSSRLLVAAGAPDAFAPDLVSMVATLLHYGRMCRSVSPGWEDRFAPIMPAVDNAVTLAHRNRAISQSSRICSLDALIGNLSLMLQREPVALAVEPKDFPVVVCGAGPSLAGQIDLLRKYRDRIAVICVGHAFSTLMRAGIEPDLVAEIDPNARINWRHGIAPGNIPLAAGLGCDPVVAGLFSRHLWCRSNQLDDSLTAWGRAAGLPLCHWSGGISVIVSALDLAVRAGFKHVALIGSDLCYSSSGQSHADDGGGNLHRFLRQVPGSDGGQVWTDENFINVKAELEKYLFSLSSADCAIANCTPGGALVAGCQAMPLTDFLTRYTGSSAASAWVAPIPAFRRLTQPPLQNTLACLNDYRRIADMIARLAAGLPSGGPAPADAGEALRQLLSAESGMTADPSVAFWLEHIRRQADDLLLGKAFPVDRQATSPWPALARRYQIVAGLTQTVAAKFESALTLSASALPGWLEQCYVNPFFARLASMTVDRFDVELAACLTRADLPLAVTDFDFNLAWQNIGTLSWRAPSGQIEVWDPAVQQQTLIAGETAAAVDALALQPGDGLIWLAPCGWRYVFELQKQHPQRPLLILEPFPALLRWLVHSSLFMHQLSADTAIMGVDAAVCPGWERRLQDYLAQWRQRGIRPRLVVHPRAAGHPLVVEWAARISSLLACSDK